MREEPDEIIYERFLAERNEKDLLMLLNRHKESLMMFLNGIVNNMHDAEELMMDSFAEIAAGPSIFLHRSSFKSWLFSIGKKLALMHLRKTRRYILHTDDELGDVLKEGQILPPEFDILKNERNRQLYEALNKLNDDYRQILILIYFEEMSPAEAGEVMGKSLRQIYHLTERGRKALKEQLGKMGFDHERY